MLRTLVFAAAFAGAIGSPALHAQAALSGGRTVLAAVVNAQGRPVVDVGLDDVVVSEGGEPRDVLDVHVADYPLTLIIDDRPQSAIPLEALRRAAQRFIARVGERPVALLRLSDAAHPVVTLDDERSVLVQRLDALTGEADATSPLETIASASALLKESGAPFSAVVVIGASPVDASAPVRGELLPQILESGAVVHVVQVQTTGNSAIDELPDDLLKVIADQSKGQFTPIFSSASYDAALDRLADRLAIELMIQYLVPGGAKTGDVRVGVRMPGSRVVGLGVR